MDDNKGAAPRAGSQTLGWFADAPGGDVNLDELFPNPEITATTPASATPTATQTPTAEDFFLKAGDTVYKSKEDAIQGTAEKDRVIAQLRAKIVEAEGRDPLRKAANEVSAQGPPKSYVEDPDVFFKDLVTAASKGDARAYAQTLQRFQMETLAPYAPLLAEVAREKGIRTAESHPDIPVKDAHVFVGSGEYKGVLEKLPALKEAIEAAETYPQLSGQLPQLYQLAYLASTGLKVPELVKQTAASSAAAAPTPRPTMTSSTPTPTPAPTMPIGAAREELLYSKDGRKQLIEEGKQRGLDKVDWGSIGI